MSALTPAGLDAAFSTIYSQQCRRVRAIATQRVKNGDQATAEDVAQEAFLRLWRYMSNGNEVANPTALLAKMTRCAAADHYRVKRNTNESAADFTDAVTALRMPVERSAEDVAVARESVREAWTGAAL